MWLYRPWRVLAFATLAIVVIGCKRHSGGSDDTEADAGPRARDSRLPMRLKSGVTDVDRYGNRQ